MIKYALQVFVVPFVSVLSLTLNTMILRRSGTLDELYPPSIFLIKYLVMLDCVGTILSLIWPFLYRLEKMKRGKFSQSLHWMVYLTYYHPSFWSIIVKTSSYLLLIFSTERLVTLLLIKQSLNVDIDFGLSKEPSPLRTKVNKLVNKFFKDSKNLAEENQPFISKMYAYLTNENFIKFLSLIAITFGVALSIPRCMWYVIQYSRHHKNYDLNLSEHQSSYQFHEYNMDGTIVGQHVITFSQRINYGVIFKVSNIVDKTEDIIVSTMLLGYFIYNLILFFQIKLLNTNNLQENPNIEQNKSFKDLVVGRVGKNQTALRAYSFGVSTQSYASTILTRIYIFMTFFYLITMLPRILFNIIYFSKKYIVIGTDSLTADKEILDVRNVQQFIFLLDYLDMTLISSCIFFILPELRGSNFLKQ